MCLCVVQEERAVVPVDLLDGVDLLREVQDGLLQAHVLCRLGEDEETAVADAGKAAGRGDCLPHQRDDLLQQVLAEHLAVLHADGVILRYVEQQRRVVVAVQPELVGVLQAVHEHAAVAQKPRLLVDEAERERALAVLGSICEGVKADEDADDLAALADGIGGATDLLEAVADAQGFVHIEQRLARAHDLFLVLFRVARVQQPAEIVIRLAEDLRDILDAAPLEEGPARPAEAVLAVLPEELDAQVVHEDMPDGGRHRVRPCGEELLREAVCFEHLPDDGLTVGLAAHEIPAEADEHLARGRLDERHAREVHPAVAAVGEQDAERRRDEGLRIASGPLVEGLGVRKGEEALAVGWMHVMAGELAQGRGDIVELRADADARQRLDDLHEILVEVQVPDGIVGQQHIAQEPVETVSVGIVERLLRADVVEPDLVDRFFVHRGNLLGLEAHVLTVIDVRHRLPLARHPEAVGEAAELLVHREVG